MPAYSAESTIPTITASAGRFFVTSVIRALLPCTINTSCPSPWGLKAWMLPGWDMIEVIDHTDANDPVVKALTQHTALLYIRGTEADADKLVAALPPERAPQLTPYPTR